jgi:hypothetical protein
VTAENWQHVPSLNSVRLLESLPPRTLVRLKCMVADVLEPEFYSAEFAIANASGERRGVRVLYEDQLQLPEGCVEVGDTEHQTKSLLQRISLMCTPVPGESHVTSNAGVSRVICDACMTIPFTLLHHHLTPVTRRGCVGCGAICTFSPSFNNPRPPNFSAQTRHSKRPRRTSRR